MSKSTYGLSLTLFFLKASLEHGIRPVERRVDDYGVELRGADVAMAQHSLDDFDGYALLERPDGESVSRGVRGDVFFNSGLSLKALEDAVVDHITKVRQAEIVLFQHLDDGGEEDDIVRLSRLDALIKQDVSAVAPLSGRKIDGEQVGIGQAGEHLDGEQIFGQLLVSVGRVEREDACALGLVEIAAQSVCAARDGDVTIWVGVEISKGDGLVDKGVQILVADTYGGLCT